jgi:methionine sulfoxide reductase heme-binding subunit
MIRPAKAVLFVFALVPAAWLAVGLYRGELGANPAETLQLETGIWALRFLLASLAITPLRRLTGWNSVIQVRRMLGLFAFFYATLHLLTYIVLDRFFDFSRVGEDIIKRPYITAGMFAFVLLIPLALTSTKGWIRRLGRKWQLLHRLVYISAAAACLHFLWKVKVMIGEPVYYAGILAVLLGFRLVWRLRQGSRIRQPAQA